MPVRKRTVDELTCECCGVVFPYKHSGGKPNRFCSRACVYSRTPEQRFWEKVNKDGPVPEACPDLGCCWCWTGSLFTDSGYGQFWLDGTNRRAHIVSYEWAVGPTDGQQVQHLCNVRVCIRPTHLTLGTAGQNMQYASTTGQLASGDRHWLRAGPDTRQHAKGEQNGMARLTEQDVREILALLANGTPRSEVARRYSITYWTVRDIEKRKIWRHVT